MIKYNEVLESKIAKEIIEWLEVIVIAFIMAVIVKTFVIETTKVSGPSMQPTLQTGERLFICKFSYAISDPQRGDIIVFVPESSEDNYIKRVIGLPDETIDIIDGKVYINDEELEEDYINGLTYTGLEHIDFPYEIDEGEYFVLGDNRMHSDDSRSKDLGKVTKSNIKGKAIFRCYPLNNMGTFKNIEYKIDKVM